MSDWSELEKIAPPHKWIDMYREYQKMLTQEDTAAWWQEQYNIANAERNEIKQREEEWIKAFGDFCEVINKQIKKNKK